MKNRAYGDGDDARSAAAALAVALNTMLRLFAPHLPYVTEEVWSWWQSGSIHTAPWPSATEFADAASTGDDLELYPVAGEILGAIRKAKSSEQRSLATPVARAVIIDTERRLQIFERARRDVLAAGRVEAVDLAAGDELAVSLAFAPPEEAPAQD